MDKVERLYGINKPMAIPEEFRRQRIMHLKNHLAILADREIMDLDRIHDVTKAIKHWRELV